MRLCDINVMFCAVGALTLIGCSDSPGTPTGGGGSTSAATGTGGSRTSAAATGTGGGSTSAATGTGGGSTSAATGTGGGSTSAATGTGGGSTSAATGTGGGSTSAATGTGGGTAGSSTSASSSTGSGPVDECANGTAGCDVHATCADLPDGFTCTCKAGYQGDGATCTDIDECAVGTSNCDPAAACTNTMGGVICKCPAGTVDVNGNGSSCLPVGQGCGQAIAVSPASLPVTVMGSTTAGSSHYGFAAGACPGVAGPVGAASNDIAYSFTPTTSGGYVFTLTGSGFDSALYVVTDCAAVGASCLGAVDNACSGCAEPLSVTLTAGTKYFIIVDGSSDAVNAEGQYSLQIKPAKSFTNPLQIDVSALLVDDTIVNNGVGVLDATQVPMDGSGYDLLTAAVGKQLGGANAVGLPNNATFAADANHPLVHLGWDNSNDGPNSRVVKSGFSFTLPVPVDTYAQLQVYGLSTEGTSSMQFTLTYSDATTDIRNITFPDWYTDPAPAGQFFLINGLDRIGAGLVFDSSKDPAVAGVNLNPNPAKTLVSVFVNHLASNGWFTFYGSTGW